MAHIFEEGNVSVHIPDGSKETTAHCYDLRDEEFLTVVIVDLFTFLPVGYEQEDQTHNIPNYRFVMEAMESCANHEEELWRAWTDIKDRPLL